MRVIGKSAAQTVAMLIGKGLEDEDLGAECRSVSSLSLVNAPFYATVCLSPTVWSPNAD
jgi:hypothetical protein